MWALFVPLYFDICEKHSLSIRFGNINLGYIYVFGTIDTSILFTCSLAITYALYVNALIVQSAVQGDA